ncbi:hypothetical protein NCS56_01213300 [Fusarium sp. Ph1]|nr:hypothetical protein NCS56_01213300 [Fusarium sp. Ph1]
MKVALFASAIFLSRLGLALPPPQPVVIEPIDAASIVVEPIDPDSGSPGCCVPSMCRCLDGKYYLFNKENKQGGGTGCNPPWGFLGDTVGAIPEYCC